MENNIGTIVGLVSLVVNLITAGIYIGKLEGFKDLVNYRFAEQDKKLEKWQVAPPLLEDIYNFEDALLVGCMLTVLQNNCDRVKMACLAQLVNVIAPIMTENGGKAWMQTIFYPFFYASLYGNGKTLRSVIECDSYECSDKDVIPYLAASIVHNDAEDEVIVYAINRSLNEEMELNVTLGGFENYRLIEHTELYSDDLKAVNEKDVTRVAPATVAISQNADPILKKHSWNMLRYKKNNA